MVLPQDFLDTMAWDVAISGILLAAAAIKLRYQPSTASIEEKDGHLRLGFAAAIAACGSYLLLSGLIISFTWPFAISSGVYNVLFGGIATLGGLVLLAGAIVLFFNANPRRVCNMDIRTYVRTAAFRVRLPLFCGSCRPVYSRRSSGKQMVESAVRNILNPVRDCMALSSCRLHLSTP
jgi:hypothetical protein